MLFKLIGFFFRAIKSVFFLFVPEETRAQLKEGAKEKAATAGKAGFSFVGRIIVPLLAFCFICFVSVVYAFIPSVFDMLSRANERDRYDMSDNYDRPRVRRGVDSSENNGAGSTNTQDSGRKPRRTITIKDDDEDLLQGTWQAQSLSRPGSNITQERIAESQLIFEGDVVTIKGNTGKDSRLTLKYKIDSSKSPKQIEMLDPNIQRIIFGIYELNGDTLRISLALRPPTNFEYEPSVDKTIMVLTKVN